MNDATVITRKIEFSELVDKEARYIVTQMIEEELDKQNLPLPKEASLEIHVTHILAARPDIIDKARANVDAKLDAYTESLKKIGVELQVIRAIEITL